MPPLSGKQRKAQLKLKRAVKRGDATPQPDQPKSRSRRGRPNPRQTPDARRAADQAARSSRNLQSQFVKLDKRFLDDTRALAGSTVLRRPIPGDVVVLRPEWMTPTPPNLKSQLTPLALPRRPKWRYQMSKDELDANEQAYFRTWLAQQDAIVEQWQRALSAPSATDQTTHADPADDPVGDSETQPMPHPPTHFERNIEVWRQFWRVTEISQILLVLLDSRCPPLHLPSSLVAHLNIPTSLSPQGDPGPRNKQSSRFKTPSTILVLTKVDISGLARTAAWMSFLSSNYPGVPVVPVEAYASLAGEQGHARYEPHLPGTFREKLVHTIRDVHEQLLQPPHWVTAPREGESEEERTQRVEQWTPRVKRVIDWDGVLKAKGKLVGKVVGGAAVPRGQDVDVQHGAEGAVAEEGGDVTVSDTDEEQAAGDAYEWKEPEFLTVGVIGQPNVGKSSLLNAIFGTTRVRASRTPGKTKHFQTLFWTSDVRLVDCPGLVMPSFVPMDIQVLSGVLPISRVSAVPFCVHQLARLLPLEHILELTHPSPTSVSDVTADPGSISQPRKYIPKAKSASYPAPVNANTEFEDKRTWRPGQRSLGPTKVESKAQKWTANDIMTAYALKKGWVTAKAGRPDIHRAGNAILRLVAEGKIPWGFWPPGTMVSSDDGIWLKGGMKQHAWDEFEVDSDREEDEDSEEEDSETEEEVSDEENVKLAELKIASGGSDAEDSEDLVEDENRAVRGRNFGRFGALGIDDE